MTRQLLLSVTLDDCRVDTFRAGGPGGQNQNKVNSGVRIVHPPSGSVGESREHRSQLQNKKAAFRRMVDHPKFRFWLASERARVATGKTAEERVAEQLQPANLRFEVRADGRWVETV